MPGPAVFFVRAALMHLAAGSVLGALLLAAKGGLALPALLYRAWPLHSEIMLVGWAVQLAVGVAYWILPKHSQPPVRGPLWPVVTAAVLINAGVATAGLGPLLDLPPLTLSGRVAEAVAVALFAGTAWPRVKAFGR
jgi:hypothetical protein